MQEELNPELQIELSNESATESLGRLLACSLTRPMVICLSGDLGAGKTTLTRGFLRAMGHSGAVKSPTFTLVESYEFEERIDGGAQPGGVSPLKTLGHGYAVANSGPDSGPDSGPELTTTSHVRPAGLHHFDLYRIEDPEELDFIGFEEYLEGDYHTIIEWPARAGDRIVAVNFEVRLIHVEHHRRAFLRGLSSAAMAWIEKHRKTILFNN